MKVFVNSLERFVDRRIRMERILDSLGIEFEYFYGPDAKKLTQAEMDPAYDEGRAKRNLGRALSLNEIACTMAHRAIYRKMLDENIEKACILEDDILLDREFPQALAFLDALYFRNTVVKLDNYREKNTPCSIWARRRVTDRVVYKKPVTVQWMTWGYVLDRGAALSILRSWPKIEFVCDDWERMSTAVRMRCVQPAVVLQNKAVESILEEGRAAVVGKAEKRKDVTGKAKRLLYIIKTIFRMLLP